MSLYMWRKNKLLFKWDLNWYLNDEIEEQSCKAKSSKTKK